MINAMRRGTCFVTDQEEISRRSRDGGVPYAGRGG